MTVLVVEPTQRPYVKDIDGSLKSMQELISGKIEAIYLFRDTVAVISNDMGKLIDLPMNRALYDSSGKIDDVICGTFFICGTSEDNFVSLTDEQITCYSKLFHVPELFVHIAGHLMIVQLGDCEDEGGMDDDG